MLATTLIGQSNPLAAFKSIAPFTLPGCFVACVFGFVVVLIHSAKARRTFAECLHAALRAVGALFAVLLGFLALLFMILIFLAGGYAIYFVLAVALAAPFLSAAAFAGGLLGYSIQKIVPRSASGSIGWRSRV